MKTSEVISLFALFISCSAFVYPLFLQYLSRPKLNLSLRIVNFRDTNTGQEEKMLQVLIINGGYRPIIISQCEYTGSPNNMRGNVGIYDELKAPYGLGEIVLPVLLEPAKTHAINIFRAGVLSRTDMSIDDIYLIDAKGKKHHVPKSEIENVKRQVIKA
jgi:hypothetical protein